MPRNDAKLPARKAGVFLYGKSLTILNYIFNENPVKTVDISPAIHYTMRVVSLFLLNFLFIFTVVS